jgi:AraC-like DNA-binding protein
VERARLAGQVRVTAARVLECATLADVDRALLADAAGAIVLAPDPARTARLLAALYEFRQSDPATAIVMCLRGDDRTVHQLATFTRAGIDDVVLMDEPSAMEVFRRRLSRRLEHALPTALVRRITPRREPPVPTYWTWCVRAAFDPLAVSDVAERFDEDETAVRRHLVAAGMCKPKQLVRSARFIHVAHRLDTTRRIATVARSLGFGRPSDLSRLVRGECGLTPSELQRLGAVEVATRVITTRLVRSPGSFGSESRVGSR